MKRDYSIDNIRGIATLSVLYIHTVWWSGESYVPGYVKNLALLLDVPVFFVLTGCLIAIFKKIDFISQSYKIVMYFAIYVCFYQLLFWEFNIESILKAIFMIGLDTPSFFVVNGSYWFVPTYVVSLLVSSLLIIKHENIINYLIPLSFLYLTYAFVFNYSIGVSLLGVGFDSIVYYSSCILLGFRFIKSKDKRIFYFALLLMFFCWLMWILIENKYIFLQNFKFPLSLPYVMASCFSIFLTFYFVNKINKKIPILTFIGASSIHFYLAQGISSTLIYHFVNHIYYFWLLKLAILFLINLIIFLSIGYSLVFGEKFLRKIFKFLLKSELQQY